MAIEKDLNTYTLNPGESFIVDTNVWIYLFSPFSTNDFCNGILEKQIEFCNMEIK